MTTFDKLLICEGKNDKQVIFHFCTAHNLGKFHEKKEIKATEGKEKLLNSLSTLIKAHPHRRIGILIDADENHNGTWESMKNTINELNLGFNLPEEFPETGLVSRNETNPMYPLLGIWIMPDNKTTGTLEHFLSFLVSSKDQPLLELAKESIKKIQDISPPHEIKGENRLAKATLHTFLAWQKDPGLPYGTAITKRYLDPSCKQAEGFAHWLSEVFFDELRQTS